MSGLIVLRAIYPELLVGTNTHMVDGEIRRMHHMEHLQIIRHAFSFKHFLYFCTVASVNCIVVIVNAILQVFFMTLAFSFFFKSWWCWVMQFFAIISSDFHNGIIYIAYTSLVLILYCFLMFESCNFLAVHATTLPWQEASRRMGCSFEKCWRYLWGIILTALITWNFWKSLIESLRWF